MAAVSVVRETRADLKAEIELLQVSRAGGDSGVAFDRRADAAAATDAALALCRPTLLRTSGSEECNCIRLRWMAIRHVIVVGGEKDGEGILRVFACRMELRSEHVVDIPRQRL